MSKEENLKKNLKSGKRRASRLVALDEATRDQLLKAVLENTLEAKAKPKPTPTEKTSKVLDDLIAFVLQSDLEAEPEHLVEGIMQALQSGILGGNFIAPTEATVLSRVKGQLKLRDGAIGDNEATVESQTNNDPLDEIPF